MKNDKLIPLSDLLNNFVIDHFAMIKTIKIHHNKGQIPGVPKNPRFIVEKGQKDLKTSLEECPEFLFANKLIVVPYADEYVVLAGNMRLYECIDLGILEVPCIILNPNTPPDKLKRFMVIDNIGYGQHDWDILANEFDVLELEHWGLSLPDIDIEDDDEGPGSPEPEVKLTIHFKGNLEEFDKIKLKIETMIEKFEGISLT